MKVFIPHKKDRNIYFDEIITYSNSHFIFGNYKDYDESFDIVNIHFQEAIFDRIPPNELQLKELEDNLLYWKKKSKIILTLNDHVSHYDDKHEYYRLFKLIEKYVDGVIHLGNYSLENYKSLFSDSCKHTIIFHPLYESLIKNCEISDFETKYSINFKNKYIVSSIGDIRSKEEVALIFEIFRNIPNKNKLLIVPNMFQFVKMPKYIPYRFRNVYKKIAEKIYCFPLKKSQYLFGYKFIEYSYMVDLVKKSSLIIIPRLKNLNSGNLFLGLTFDKPMIIPRIGNLTEFADFFDLPSLDLKKKNYTQLIKNILVLNDQKFYSSSSYLEKKNNFHPCKIARDYDNFFKQLINN